MRGAVLARLPVCASHFLTHDSTMPAMSMWDADAPGLTTIWRASKADGLGRPAKLGIPVLLLHWDQERRLWVYSLSPPSAQFPLGFPVQSDFAHRPLRKPEASCNRNHVS